MSRGPQREVNVRGQSKCQRLSGAVGIETALNGMHTHRPPYGEYCVAAWTDHAEKYMDI